MKLELLANMAKEYPGTFIAYTGLMFFAGLIVGGIFF